MNPDQQRISIAEACGWLRGHACKTCGHGGDQWLSPERTIEIAIPDYLNDLNAMNTAEKTLNEKDRTAYFWELEAVVDKYHGKVIAYATGDATAAQRAEAFLRAKGLWKD